MPLQTEDGQEDFLAGFDGLEITAPLVAETPPAEPEIEYAKITVEEYERLKGIANMFDESRAESKKQMDTAFGKIGGMQQALTALQTATPSGQGIEVSEEDFEELSKEFPELARMQIAGMNKAMSKLKGTGGAPAEPIDVQKMLDERAETVERKVEAKLLTKEHRDWRDVTKSEDYLTWLKAQGAEYEAKIMDSWDSDEIGESITKFKDTKKVAPAPQVKAPVEQRNRFKEAITPKGDGGIVDANSADDDFEAGFNSRKH